jgi:hypothetical protein
MGGFIICNLSYGCSLVLFWPLTHPPTTGVTKLFFCRARALFAFRSAGPPWARVLQI